MGKGINKNTNQGRSQDICDVEASIIGTGRV